MSVGLKANVDGTSGTVQVNGNDVVTVNSSGNVGIGLADPSQKLDVAGGISLRPGGSVGANAVLTADATSGANGISLLAGFASGGYGPIKFVTSATERMRIDSAGTLTSQPTYDNTAAGSTVVVTSTGLIRRTSSSIKYKKDVESLDTALATNAINNLRPVWYRTKNPEGDDKATWSHIGLIAEEVHEVEPRLVRYRTAEVIDEQKPVLDEAGDPVLDDEGNPTFTTERVERELAVPEPEDVDYARLSVLLLAEVQSLRDRVAALEAA